MKEVKQKQLGECLKGEGIGDFIFMDQELASDYKCNICFEIKPDSIFLCSKCQNVICEECMNRAQGKCPFKCEKDSVFQSMLPIQRKTLYSAQMKCQKCNKIILLENMSSHPKDCSEILCSNYYCWKASNPEFQLIKGPNNSAYKFCSLECKFTCLILDKVQDSKLKDEKAFDIRNILSTIIYKSPEIHKDCRKNFCKEKSIINIPLLISSDGFCQFTWEMPKKSPIQFSQDKYSLYLDESYYCFRSIISDSYFKSGKFYWEIILDSRTENEVKIGVVCSNNFDYNRSFSDFDFGYAYFGKGQLRNGNDSSGKNYGIKFLNYAKIGVFLDMDKGILMFSQNDKDLGIAFQNKDLTQPPIFAAVALQHKAGIRLVDKLKAYKIFPNLNLN